MDDSLERSGPLRTDVARTPERAPAATVELRGVRKRMGSVLAVDGISLLVRPGEIVALLGPSGCGKTTTLRLIAGLEGPSEGQVWIGGELASSARPHRLVAPERRRLGFVFQAFALWPHMTVRKNIDYCLRAHRIPRAERQRRIAQYLAMVNLTGYEDRYPGQLSGGQQQRVALARALSYEPRVLLLDEPLSNVDAKDRERLRDELGELLHRLAITTIYVTHDQTEALALADRIAIMDHGRIVEEGDPRAIYERPRTRFAAEFGLTNVIRGTATLEPDGSVVFAPEGTPLHWRVEEPIGPPIELSRPCLASIRPARIRLLGPGDPPGTNPVDGRVEEVEYLGETYQVVFTAAGLTLRARRDASARAGPPPVPGPGRIEIPPSAIHLFPE